MRMIRFFLPAICFLGTYIASAQNYPKGYFRNPLNVPMQLVGNFGELRTNHWHMGLDIRTQQRENLPVVASADGYISRVKIEPGGFGRAIYISHPNGFTTLYAHLNAFMPALDNWVKHKQYEKESWAVELTVPPQLFSVRKGQFIAYSGNTGGSAGPHVHFEIRDTKTDNCVNPLLFGFPVADAVAPAISRLAMYDRTRSTYEQQPQILGLKKTGNKYSLANSGLIRTGSRKISFAITAVDRFSGSNNPNGIYSTKTILDGETISSFVHDNISYDDTRYMNAQIDYKFYAARRGWLQHLTPLPGDETLVYTTEGDGAIELTDEEIHLVRIEVRDAYHNLSVIEFRVQFDPSLSQNFTRSTQRWSPGEVNIFESSQFEAFSTTYTVYDTVPLLYRQESIATFPAISPVHHFIGNLFPAQDYFTVKISPSTSLTPEQQQRIIIKNISGSRTTVEKAVWQNGWGAAKFRQFGSFQLFVDLQPPAVNAPPSNLSRASRIVFTPTDNFKTIKSFRAELDGKWLRFTNNKGRSWIYYFDEHFSRGRHDLKVIVEDVAGNVTTRTWTVTR